MIDCHFHLWTDDTSTPGKRAERAEQVGEQARALGVERICLIGERGETVEECREHNRTIGRFVAEYPDLFYGWARADPTWGEDAVAEFRRTVVEDGLIGLKLYAQAFLDDPAVEPLAEAAVELDVPIISHVAHRLGGQRNPKKPLESDSDNVRALAESFPKLTLISGHIGGGGVWEYRIRNLRDVPNVLLDTSGSVVDAGQLEMAVDQLGADRLVFGTDTWFLPGVGKLRGANLTPDQKAEIGYRMASLIPDSAPNKLSEAERDAGVERAREQFASLDGPREETIVDANAYVGNFPWRDLDADVDAVLETMDREGIDSAVVSSFDAVFYRNPQPGNRELAAEIAGHEDRFVPLATINPIYAGWRADLRECVDDLGMRGVRLFPLYHHYAIDDPAVVELLDLCADRDLPVMFVGMLEDSRQNHPNWKLKDVAEAGSKHWSESHVEALIDVLQRSPAVDVIVANVWAAAPRIAGETTTSYPAGVRLRNRVRSGKTLFVLDDLYMFFRHQGEELAESVGVEHLVTGPKLPLYNVGAHYIYTEEFPGSAAEKDRIRSENVLSLFE